MHCAHISLVRPALRFSRFPATLIHHAADASFTYAKRTRMSTTTFSKLPIHLVLDFDGTFTRRDTMHLVAESGYAHQAASGRIPQPPPWSEIVDAYMADFRAHANTYIPQATERTSPEQESAWLNSLEQIEEASFQRARAAGIFDSLTKVEMETAGRSALRNRHLELRDGWHNLAMCIQRHNAVHSDTKIPIRILSVNWSATFIRGVLQQAHEEQQVKDQLIHAQHIYANEVPSITQGGTTSSHAGYSSSSENTAIRTSGAKVRVMRKICRTAGDKEESLIFYVGDSTTDLDCLLTADFGFCVRDDPMTSSQKDLAETCQRIGVRLSPIAGIYESSDKEKTLWWVQDFSEIVRWLDQATSS